MSFMVLTLVVGFSVAVLAAPAVGVLCKHLQIVDRPDGHRKLHSTIVPLTGGPTLLISILCAVAAGIAWQPDALAATRGDAWFLLCLSIATAVLVTVGMLDDRFGLRGRQKLAGQFIAAVIMVPSGIEIQSVTIFGEPVSLGVFSICFTVFWILGAINALNLIDGVDGLASTTGIVLSLSIAAVTFLQQGRNDGLLIALALAGALSGFLVYNFPPARMFLGDSGSMLIGLVLGTVALKCSVKQYTAVALIMPTAIWAIPIFDVAMAIVRRRLTGRSIYATDRGHLHHCLQRRGHTGGRLLLVVGTLCAITGMGAIASAFFENDIYAIASVITALSLLVVSRSFGHTEMTLMARRFRRVTVSMFTRRRHGDTMHHEQIRLQGHHEWALLWDALMHASVTQGLHFVELTINMPSAGEFYHATYRNSHNVDAHELWRCELPLIVDNFVIGHIRVEDSARGQFTEWLADLSRNLEPVQATLHTLLAPLRRKPNPAPVSPSATLALLPERVGT
ncbi:MAG: MraY family glycosyltransferase [Planctomyces sp.]|jgi:UDP-GlcNAc:undecaprenyl-phosphate GlcNAc-1-phosphate transferase